MIRVGLLKVFPVPPILDFQNQSRSFLREPKRIFLKHIWTMYTHVAINNSVYTLSAQVRFLSLQN